MGKKTLMIFSLLMISILSVSIISAKETMVGSGFECDNLIENAGSVRLVDFSYPNVEVEVTINDYIGNGFFGFLFSPMKLNIENLASEIKIETRTHTNPKTGEEMERKASDEEPFSALAFKLQTDPFVGQLTFFRVYSGTLVRCGVALRRPAPRRSLPGGP